MKVSELRIGNWLYNHRGVRSKILAIDGGEHSGVEFENHDVDIIRNCNPIPLTEEWLDRFYVERVAVSGMIVNGAKYYDYNDIVFYELGGSYYLPIGQKLSNKPGTKCIKFDYVHEFQNIFNLTEEELTLKD